MNDNSLHIDDAAALCVGRVILAWGNLDFRIESLMLDGWSVLMGRRRQNGQEVEDWPPSEGRSTHRLKLLRRYFLAIAEDDPAGTSEFGKLHGRWQKVEKIRSSLAHGLTVFNIDEDGPYVSSWSFTHAQDADRMSRKDDLNRYSLDLLNESAMEMDALEKEFSDLFEHFRRPFLLNTIATTSLN